MASPPAGAAEHGSIAATATASLRFRRASTTGVRPTVTFAEQIIRLLIDGPFHEGAHRRCVLAARVFLPKPAAHEHDR